jgi:hypothetical protein
MEPVNYLALSLNTASNAGFAHSALPNAPVVPTDDSARRGQRAPRARAVIAGGLYRLGDAIGPARA